MKEKFSNRIGMFDLIKGFFVLGMLLFHAKYQGIVTAGEGKDWLKEIALLPLKVGKSSIIPMLFLICGYEFRKKSMKKAIEMQLKFVWKFYVFSAVVIVASACIKCFFKGGGTLEVLKTVGLSFLLGVSPDGNYFGIFLPTIGPMWFVVTFVLSGIFLNAILLEERLWAQLFLTVFLASIGITLKDLNIPFCFQQSLICTLYMYIGWLMKKYRFFGQEVPSYLYVVACFFVLFSAYFGYAQVAENNWSNGLVDVFSGIPGAVITLVIFFKLDCFKLRVFDGMRWLGRHVFQICCIHTVFYHLFPRDEFSIIFPRRIGGSLLLFGIYFITAVGGCLLYEQWQYKTKS